MAARLSRKGGPASSAHTPPATDGAAAIPMSTPPLATLVNLPLRTILANATPPVTTRARWSAGPLVDTSRKSRRHPKTPTGALSPRHVWACLASPAPHWATCLPPGRMSSVRTHHPPRASATSVLSHTAPPTIHSNRRVPSMEHHLPSGPVRVTTSGASHATIGDQIDPKRPAI